MKQLKAIVALLALVLLLTSAAMYALGKKDTKQDKPKAATTVVQKNQNHGHEEGSAACQEKHAKGECQGHEPGQPHMEKGANPGDGHAEGSAACQEKHAKGECQGHEPGQPHEEKQ